MTWGKMARRATGAAGLFMAAVLLAMPATSAAATTTNIVISSPAPGTSFTSGFTSASVSISGNANIGQQALETNVINDVQVSVTYGGAQVFSCAHSANCGATNGQGSTNFSFSAQVLRNGPYNATATVAGTECNVLNSCTPRSSTASTNFSVGVHPAAPRNLRAQVNGDRSVTVSWSQNPEPDVIGYQVLRKDPGASSAHAVNNFLQGTNWSDNGTTSVGGDYGYSVIAFRPGADGTATATTVLSTSSAAATASVPAPPVPTTTVSPTGQPVVATTTTVVPDPVVPAGPDLSSFLDQANKAGAIPAAPPKAVAHPAPAPVPRVGAPSVAAPGVPDTYAPTLPYAAPALGATPPSAGGADSPQVALSGQPAAKHHNRSVLFSVAGGLVLCALGFAVRTANRRPGAPPLEPITGADPRSGGGPGTVVVVPASAAAKAAARSAALAAAGAAPYAPAEPPPPTTPAAVTVVTPPPPPPPPAQPPAPPPARAKAPPTVDDAVDYFRLIREPHPAPVEDKVEATSPAG